MGGGDLQRFFARLVFFEKNPQITQKSIPQVSLRGGVFTTSDTMQRKSLLTMGGGIYDGGRGIYSKYHGTDYDKSQ